ncbi:Rrf2 family transcriptional regulator [Halobacteriovorax sp. JY17]|uniref:Rrf2 family transcriptional regulator n=1 Tax=Halobacteriovorax sp. JY17 TaxID=2014617 RepID=UPI000C50CE59|nr:Rrf2 family transcriptional regulator [Halobacteriovorax sp. JY17]PIK14787.1 MAG: BadM/Rrf2 family transcriptional regulator [Halobacteriovorax sp. JY17]
MKLTTKTDYCLRTLIYLQTVNRRAKIQEIADTYRISKNHLSVAVNLLSELDYIITVPGPKGGIEFNKKMKNTSVGNLVKRVENLEIVECFNQETNTCNLSPSCKLKFMLSKATKAFLKELKDYKIKDLI